MISGTYYLNKSLLVLIAFLFSAPAFSQDQTSGYNNTSIPDSLIYKDSTKLIKLLIIPFSPSMYFSDADKDIAEVSQLESDKVRARFNGSLETNLTEHLGLYYETKSLSKQPDAMNDLDIIFGSINYKPEEKETGEDKGSKSTLKDLRKKLPGKEDNKQPSVKVPYMNIAMADGRLADYLFTKYQSDYFVFINQFEIKTDYKNCLDLQMRKYYREIKVHYSIFDKTGKFVSGDVIIVPYHSNENKLDAIVRDNFGLISSALLNKLYLKK